MNITVTQTINLRSINLSGQLLHHPSKGWGSSLPKDDGLDDLTGQSLMQRGSIWQQVVQSSSQCHGGWGTNTQHHTLRCAGVLHGPHLEVTVLCLTWRWLCWAHLEVTVTRHPKLEHMCCAAAPIGQHQWYCVGVIHCSGRKLHMHTHTHTSTARQPAPLSGGTRCRLFKSTWPSVAAQGQLRAAQCSPGEAAEGPQQHLYTNSGRCGWLNCSACDDPACSATVAGSAGQLPLQPIGAFNLLSPQKLCHDLPNTARKQQFAIASTAVKW